MEAESTPISDVFHVLILVTPHGNDSNEQKECAIFRTMTTSHLDKFVGRKENHPSAQNMDAFKKIFGTYESKLNLKRKQNAQSDQIEAKKVNTSVR